MEKMAARWLHGCYVRAGTGSFSRLQREALVRPLEFPTFRPKFCFLVGFWRLVNSPGIVFERFGPILTV
jgi:hypothetical protein